MPGLIARIGATDDSQGRPIHGLTTNVAGDHKLKRHTLAGDPVEGGSGSREGRTTTG